MDLQQSDDKTSNVWYLIWLCFCDVAKIRHWWWYVSHKLVCGVSSNAQAGSFACTAQNNNYCHNGMFHYHSLNPYVLIYWVVELQHSLTLQGFSWAYCAVTENILACDQAPWWGKDFACQIFFAIFPTKELVHRVKISIPTPYTVIGNCEGGRGGVGGGGLKGQNF